MLYNINERPPFGKLVMFAIQLMLSVFVATVLIAQICGVAVSGALVGAGLSTIIYLIITRFKSPMFLSNNIYSYVIIVFIFNCMMSLVIL